MKTYGNEKTHLELTGKAFEIYSDTDPLTIKEFQTEDGYRYNMTGVIEADNLTEDEVIENILSLGE